MEEYLKLISDFLNIFPTESSGDNQKLAVKEVSEFDSGRIFRFTPEGISA